MVELGNVGAGGTCASWSPMASRSAISVTINFASCCKLQCAHAQSGGVTAPRLSPCFLTDMLRDEACDAFGAPLSDHVAGGTRGLGCDAEHATGSAEHIRGV